MAGSRAFGTARPVFDTASGSSSHESNDDTIHVASAPALDANDDENASQVSEHVERDEMRRERDEADYTPHEEGTGRMNVSTYEHASPLSEDGPCKNESDAEDEVEEYKLTSDDEADEKLARQEDEEIVDDDHQDDDTKSHISLSSDIGDDHMLATPLPHALPWQHMTREERGLYEKNFGAVFNQPLQGSWSYTEDYHRCLDELMVRYTDDFPFAQWVTDKITVQEYIARHFQRHNWRITDGRVYMDRSGAHYRPGLQQAQQIVQQQMQRQQFTPVNVNPAQPGRALQISRSQHMGMPPPGYVAASDPQSMSGGLPPPGVANLYSSQRMMPSNIANQPGMAPPHRKAQHGLSVPPTSTVEKTTSSSPRPKKASSPPPAPTPPYPVRERPDDRKPLVKTSRGTKRRQAEAEEYPWNREIDFEQAKIANKRPDTWSMAIYDTATLNDMHRVRGHNAPIFEKLEDDISTKQRVSRSAKKRLNAMSDPVSEEELAEAAEYESPAPRSKGGRKKRSEAAPADPYHAGNFAFATSNDQQLAYALGKRKPEELIAAGEKGAIPMIDLTGIKICWSPGKKGVQPQLQQATFSVKDSVVTRLQLANTPILNQRAAECIIDFCPDLLWRETLLRIMTEGGFSNKEMRDRVCLNGCFSDRATIAKRLGAALGKETTNPKAQNYELEVRIVEWANANRKDYHDYQRFFGKHPPPLRLLNMPKKRKAKAGAVDASSDAEGRSSKRQKTDSDHENDDEDSGADDIDDDIEQVAGAEDEDNAEDAVSAQGSDELDAMSD